MIKNSPLQKCIRMKMEKLGVSFLDFLPLFGFSRTYCISLYLMYSTGLFSRFCTYACILLLNGHLSIEAWYCILSICFFNASRSMFAIILASIAPVKRTFSLYTWGFFLCCCCCTFEFGLFFLNLFNVENGKFWMLVNWKMCKGNCL
jgi:hypothetical protein